MNIFGINITWGLVGQLLVIGIPALSIIIGLILKFVPKSRKYFSFIYFGLKTIDEIIDAILEESPNNVELKNINNIVDRVLTEFEQAGFPLDEKAVKQKVEQKISGKNGISVDKDGTIHFEVSKDF